MTQAPAAPHTAPGLGRDVRCPAYGTWQVSGRHVPRRLVRAEFPEVHAMFPAGRTVGRASPCGSGEVTTPPSTDGMCGCVSEGRPAGPVPAWPLSHPCFVRRVWNVLGHGALLPGGDSGAIALISLLDRFSSSFQLRTGQGPSSQPLPAQLVYVCPGSGRHEPAAGSGGLPRGGACSRVAVWALGKPFQTGSPPFQLPFITGSLECDPPSQSWESEVCRKPCSQDLGDLGQAGVCQLP